MKIPPKTPPQPAQQRPTPGREAWSLATFEKIYNAIAERRGGWNFEKTPGNIRRVEQDWATSKNPTIDEFAEERFEFDQRT